MPVKLNIIIQKSGKASIGVWRSRDVGNNWR